MREDKPKDDKIFDDLTSLSRVRPFKNKKDLRKYREEKRAKNSLKNEDKKEKKS